MYCFIECCSQLLGMRSDKRAGSRGSSLIPFAPEGWCEWFARAYGLVFVLILICQFPVESVRAESYPHPDVTATQAAGGAYIGTDQKSDDFMIRVGPPGTSAPGMGMYIGRNPGTGDRVIHVVPPPEEKQSDHLLIGPLWISPEIVLPAPRNPRSPGNPRSSQ